MLPLLQSVERRENTESSLVLPCVTLQQICEVDAATAALVRERLFPEEVYEQMEGGKWDDNKFNPNNPCRPPRPNRGTQESPRREQRC